MSDEMNQFVEMWRGTYEVYGKTQTDAATAIVASALSEYDLDIIKRAILMHISDPAVGMFPPTPAHVIKNIKAIYRSTPDYSAFAPNGDMVRDRNGDPVKALQ